MTAKAIKKKLVSCMLVGDCKVGKSVLSLAFSNRCFPECLRYIATVFDNVSGSVAFSEIAYTVNIYDTSGEHTHTDLRGFCYDKSDMCVITYSVGSRASFNNVREFWIPEAKKRMNSKQSIILVGCQSELRYDNKYRRREPVAYREGLDLAEEHGLGFFQECSAINLIGVKEVFESVVSLTLRNRRSKKTFRKRIGKLGKSLACSRPRTDTF